MRRVALMGDISTSQKYARKARKTRKKVVSGFKKDKLQHCERKMQKK